MDGLVDGWVDGWINGWGHVTHFMKSTITEIMFCIHFFNCSK